MSLYPFLKDNIEALEKHNPAFYHWISSQNIDEEILKSSLFTNEAGILDWKMENGIGIFENIMPNIVYNGWKVEEKADTSATIIVGCNVGYGVNHVLMNTPDTHKVVVTDPNPHLLLACIGQTDYRPFIECGKIHFLPQDENVLESYVKDMDLQFVYGKIHLRVDMPSQQMGPEYSRWCETIHNKLESFSVEMTTLRLKQDVMVGNELNNYSRIITDGSLSPLKDSAKGMSAVILGAGPSLAKFAPEFVKNRGHALYATALQTLPILQYAGLKPDFCIGIDYNASMSRVYGSLDKEWAKDIPLIYSSKLDHEVLKEYPGPTIPMWTLGGIGTFAMNQHETVFDAGSNVSVTLCRFFEWCGASQILLTGQDFAWKGVHSHSIGHQNSHCNYDPKVLVQLKNDKGEDLTSTIQYMTSKREMEADIANMHAPVYNLYDGYALIEGTKNLTFDDVIMNGLLASQPGSLENFKRAFEASKTPKNPPVFDARSQNWTASLRNAGKRLEKLFRKYNKNQKEIHQTLHDVYYFLKQDPLYMPYLYNEILDMAGLARAKQSYAPKDFSKYKQIIKKTLKKVRHMDKCLAA